MRTIYFILFCLIFHSIGAKNDAAQFGAILFDPPKGWRDADPGKYPESVQVVVVGKGKSTFPPQLNLNTEYFTGSLKDYLEIVKKYNQSQKIEWKDLGSIETQAGTGSLSQVDVPTEWGVVRMMHVILVKDQMIYILNASALRDEFAIYYRDFFQSMLSLRYSTDPEIIQKAKNPSISHQN